MDNTFLKCFYNHLIIASTDGFIILDKNFNIIDVNSTALNKIIQAPINDVYSLPIDKLLNQNGMECSQLMPALINSISQPVKDITISNSNTHHTYIIDVSCFKSNGDTFYFMNFKLVEMDEYLELKKYIDSIVNNLPGAVYWKDIEGRYMGCNKVVASMAGYDMPYELIGKTDFDFPWKEYAEEWRQLDLEVIESGQELVREETAKLASGKTIIELTYKTPLRNANNEIIGIIGTSLDITEKKLLEDELIYAKQQAEKANELKTQFIENMQHDIRTPASGLWSVLDMLVKEEQDKELVEKLSLLRDSARELNTLCNEVISFAGDGYKPGPVIDKRIDIKELIKHVADLEKAAAYHKSIYINYHVDSNVPEVIRGDEFRLRRILINLVGNAVKFTKEGGVTIQVTCSKIIDKYAILLISIEDTGIGIPNDNKNMVYEKFSRAVSSNQGRYKGTGLGLYIVKNFINDLNGEIDFDSEQGKGTTFYITLKFRLPILESLTQKDSDNHAANSHSEKNSAPLEGPINEIADNYRVLLIEDDKIAQFAGKHVLESFGHSVDVSPNCKQALSLLQENKYDIVFSDLGLPDGSGFDVIKKVKLDKNNLNNLTVFVAITAHSNDNKKREAQRHGFLSVYTKPLKNSDAELAFNFILNNEQQNFITDIADRIDESRSVDLDYGINLIGGDKKLATEMLFLLADNIPSDINTMKEAWDRTDKKMLRDELHKFKGGIAYVGVPKLQELTEIFHQKVKSSDKLSSLISDFNNLLDEMSHVLDLVNLQRKI